MKKLLLSIGGAISILTPIATTISCGEQEPEYVHPKNMLTWPRFEENMDKYLDKDKKELLWDGIIEDGYDILRLYIENFDKVDILQWISNTDMNLPAEIIDFGVVFEKATINNKVVLTKEHLSDDKNSGMFKGSTLKGGLILEEGTEYIPNRFLKEAMVEFVMEIKIL